MDAKDTVEGKSDHDLLIRIDERIGTVETLLGNHLVHRDKREMIFLAVTLGSVITAFCSIVTVIMSFILRGV